MSENAASYVTGPAPSGAGGQRRLHVVADRQVAYQPGADPTGPTAEVPTASPVGAGDRDPVDPDVALAALRRAADLVARADLDVLDDRGLLEHTVALDRQVTRLEAQRLRAVRRVDERAAFTADACVTAGSWFKMRTRRDPNAGARSARWTRRLARFPQLRDAFEEGAVTEDHVLAVLRKAKGSRRIAALADHEEVLVTLAERGQPRDVKAAATAICDATTAKPKTATAAHTGPASCTTPPPSTGWATCGPPWTRSPPNGSTPSCTPTTPPTRPTHRTVSNAAPPSDVTTRSTRSCAPPNSTPTPPPSTAPDRTWSSSPTSSPCSDATTSPHGPPPNSARDVPSTSTASSTCSKTPKPPEC